MPYYKKWQVRIEAGVTPARQMRGLMVRTRIQSGRRAADSKSLVQNFKYPFSFANKRTYEGGWSSKVTNTGDTDLVFLEMFKADRFQDFSFSEWLAHTPPELVMAHLHIDKLTLDAIPREAPVIMPI